MKELDAVKLIKEFKGMPAGTKGAIVPEYDGSCYEVEFEDSEGATNDVLTTRLTILNFYKQVQND